MRFREHVSAWDADRARLEALGAVLPLVRSYLPPEFKRDFSLAMDAQPALSTDPNTGIPSFLTNYVDPAVFRILFAPNMAATIFGERRNGNWLNDTAFFPQVEYTGEVSSYGDFNNNGRAGVNSNWPQRQNYLYQVVKEYGERELERAGLGRINWVSEIDAAAALALNKFENLTYFFGVAGLQNYGLLNDPGLSASLTPAPKAYGATTWIQNGVIKATANEIFADIQSIFYQLVQQAGGLIDAKARLVLAMSPGSSVALTATNSFGVNVYDLLKKNFPNIRFETAVQYGEVSAANPQGVAGGNLVQLIAESVEGQSTGYCSFSEKMRAHPIVREMSAFKQKLTGGTWGAVIRQPFAIASMLGV